MARLGDENRTNVTLDEISEPAQNAVLAAENRSFYTDPGISLHRHHPGGVEQRHRRLDPGWLDDHPAVREERLPDGGPDVQPQVPGALPGDQAGQQLHEGTDPRELPEHHLLRSRRLRHRGGRQHLLRRARRPAHRAAGRGARRPDPEPLALRPGRERRGRAGPLGPRARRDGRGGLARPPRSARPPPTREVQPNAGSVARHPGRSRGPHRPARAQRAARQGLHRPAALRRRSADHDDGGQGLRRTSPCRPSPTS